MSKKKDRVQVETTLTPIPELPVEEETIYEAEAYETPQPEAGSDVTVLKPVGIGGPVPIVAPKHNTIQLQPIIVPLAVIPYMTQDSSVLRTDGRTQQGGYGYETTEATEIKAIKEADKEALRKKQRPRARLFAFLSLLLSAIVVLPYLLAYFKVNIGVSLNEFNMIDVIQKWADHTYAFTLKPVARILGVGVMGMAMLSVLFSLIGLIIGKYPKPLVCVFNLVAFAGLVADLVIDLIRKRFVPENRIVFIVLLALSLIAFVLSVVFSVLLNRMEDRAEELESEI